MSVPALGTQEFYTQESDFIQRVDPAWAEERWQADVEKEREMLGRVLGEASGRSVLDCTCGSGGQAIPLAQLGWQVTASDITVASLRRARARAQQEGLDIAFRLCDVRALSQTFSASFDWVISCMALDNLASDEEIRQALVEMLGVLRPGGWCYIRLRDFDNIRQEEPRYDFKEERFVPHGRIIRLEDWAFENATHAICTHVYLWEDERKEGYRWSANTFSYRRRTLRKADLQRLLLAAGFATIDFLPQPSPWNPYAVVASA